MLLEGMQNQVDSRGCMVMRSVLEIEKGKNDANVGGMWNAGEKDVYRGPTQSVLS